MSENQVEREIIEWMQHRKWRRQRNHVGVFTTARGQRVSIGTTGFPDWTFKRSAGLGMVEICHVEAKAPGRRPSQAQKEQIVLLTFLGEHAWWADGIERHVEKYSEVFSDG